MAFPGVWFAVTATVLSGLSPLLLIASTPTSSATSDSWLWAALLTVVVGLRYAWLVERGGRRLFEQIVWLFTYVFLGLAPLAQMRSGQYPATTPFLDTSLNARTMAVVAAGTAAFAGGVALAGRRADAGPRVDVLVAPHRVLALTAFALLMTAYYVVTVGPGAMFGLRADRTALEAAAWPDETVRAIVKACATLPLLVIFAALQRWRSQRRRRGESGPSLLPWAVLAAMALVVNPISSPRYVAGTAALAVLVALGATSSLWRARTFAVVLAAGLVLVFPYADVTRNETSSSTQRDVGPAQALSTGDFDAFDQLNNAVAYTQQEGHTYGRQLSGALFFWVPRSVWPDKPVDTGILLADFREYTFSNLSAPAWAELYIDGSWPLLGLGMAGLGVLVRRLDLRRAPADGYGVPVLAVIVPFYLVIALRGSLLQSMAGLSVLVSSGLFVSQWRRRAAARL